MRTIEKSYSISAPASEVWRALTDPAAIELWGGGPVEMDDRVGTQFKLWGGDIYGRNVAVEAGHKLVQEWYGGPWAAPSIATFLIESEHGATRLTLTHTGVPEGEVDDVDEGWDLYYVGPIKELVERK